MCQGWEEVGGEGLGNRKLDGKIKHLIKRSVDICDTELIIKTPFAEIKENNFVIMS